MNIKKIISTAFAVMASSVVAFCGNVQLAKDGKALADIVIAKDADKAARFAALDLQWHLNKITGADFAIVDDESAVKDKYSICVGQSAFTKAKAADFAKQEFLVSIDGKHTELVGLDKNDKAIPLFSEDGKGSFIRKNWPGVFENQGTMYAVYDFLENTIGVKWLTQEYCGTMLPEKKDLSIPVGEHRGKPCFAYRGGTFERGVPSTVWPYRSKEYKDYENQAFPGLSNAQRDALAILFLLRHRGCGNRNPVNHSFYHFYEMYLYKNSKNFVEYKPEIFAKGYPEGTEPPQLCYTHPETKRLVIEMIRNYFDNGGFKKRMRNIGETGMVWGEDNFSIEPMDNGSMCQCDNCKALLAKGDEKRKGSDSVLWFTFVRDIALEIKKSHPDKTISTLAYAGHEDTPTGIELPDNVKVYFCPSGNRNSPLSQYTQGQFNRMREWHEQYPHVKLGVWFYNTFPYEFYKNAGYQGVHGYFAHEATKQYRLLRELNANDGVFQCGLPGGVCIYTALENMIDPDKETDVILDEFFAQYGAASKPLRKFYDIVEKRWCDVSLRVKGKSAQEVYWASVCPASIMAELDSLVAEAESLVKTDVEKTRFANWKLENWAYMKKGFDTFTCRSTAPMPIWNATRIDNAAGDIAKVNWDAVPSEPVPMYEPGSDTPASFDMKVTRRIANDDEWLYIELVQNRDTSKVVVSPNIACFDTWEFSFARQRALPSRYYLFGPKGDMMAFANGEVNFRMNVNSTEICDHKAFFANCVGDYSAPDKWVQRLAFPLKHVCDKGVNPGDTIYVCPVTVISPAAGGKSPFSLFTCVSYTAVHTYDRAVELKLAK